METGEAAPDPTTSYLSPQAQKQTEKEAGLMGFRTWLEGLSEEWARRTVKPEVTSEMSILAQRQDFKRQKRPCSPAPSLPLAQDPSPSLSGMHYSARLLKDVFPLQDQSLLTFLLHPSTLSRCPKCRKTFKSCQGDYKHLPFIDYYVDGFQST